MEVKVSEKIAPILEKIDQFYMAEVAPREDELQHRLVDRRGYLGSDGRIHPAVQKARRDIMRASGRAGLYSLHLPEGIGGGGLYRSDMFFVEEKVYGYGVGLNPAIVAWTDGATPRLIFCREDQRQRFIDPLVRGEKTSLNAVTEPDAGSNFFELKTAATKDGDSWILNGHKAFITNAFEADIAQVFAVTDSTMG